ncbi:hypothetical protein AVEN_229120-1 [Araneus ventricosus]|uniref:Uncharacterized protein n=1 Tax=Araneus ventricosus TaxID=182803 RepID=A0A4Y2FJT0_ARAVE|nr:hypothetical protein AVEN_229120-1 [Araneus ventricosus]
MGREGSFASSMGIDMENDTITQHTMVFTSDGFSEYFLFPKLRELFSGARFSSDSDVKTAAKHWFKGQGCDFCQPGLTKVTLRSDKHLNRFGDYVEK